MTRLRCAFALVLVACFVAAAPALPQVVEDVQVADPYDARYGTPRDVDLQDIIFNPEMYRDAAVRVKGTVERDIGSGSTLVFVLRGSMGDRVRIFPINEIAVEFEEMAQKNIGEQLQVTGLLSLSLSSTDSNLGTGGKSIYITFWRFNIRPRRDPPGAQGTFVPMETLVQKAGRFQGKLVRVVGEFRGHNLFGDLPASSSESSADWVLKDDSFAVWVGGKKPKGDGFALDPKLRRDAGRWLDVTGRVEVIGGIVHLRANSVSLTTPKTAATTAVAAPPPPSKQRPQRLPLIVFTLPLDGETEVAPAGVFYVQFNNDMDEATFKDRVVFRYVGARRVGDREFVGLRLAYDGGLRTLKVDPGDTLRSGREVEIVLLPGIRDIEGQELVSRPGRELPPGVAESMRFRVVRGGGGD